MEPLPDGGGSFLHNGTARGAFFSLRALLCALHLRHGPGEGDGAAFFVGDDEDKGAIHRHFHKFRLFSGMDAPAAMSSAVTAAARVPSSSTSTRTFWRTSPM